MKRKDTNTKKMLSNKQEDFFISDLKRINLLYGSVRSGKTWISLLKWAVWVGSCNKNDKFLMVGRTVMTLKRNCLELLTSLVGERNFSYSITTKQANLFGRTVWLEGANDERSESKIRGMTLKGAYIDELTEIPEDFYLMCLSRLSETGASLIATTNPDFPKHYVKTTIIDNDVLDKQVIKFLLDDNIYLDEEYKRNLRNEYKGVYYERFINGNFVRAEGLVFPDIASNPSDYLITKQTARERIKDNCLPVGMGYDLGGNLSNFALVATAVTRDNEAIVLAVQEIEPNYLNLSDVEKLAEDFITRIEDEYKVRIEYCYIDDNYYTTVNSLNEWRYIFDMAGRIKTSMPLTDRPIMLNKLMAQKRFKLVEGETEPLLEQLQNAVFDKKTDKAIICDDGSMNIDTIDALFYSIADTYLYLTD